VDLVGRPREPAHGPSRRRRGGGDRNCRRSLGRAAVVLRAGAQEDPAALREHLAADYAKWQIPDRFEFIDEIPRTATGKFKKTALRERFATADV
jgi:acyl-CoA synthetase (AMP-forming)/AMP-acid ligase II